MSYIIVFFGTSIMWVFLFKMDLLCRWDSKFWVLAVYCIILFVISILIRDIETSYSPVYDALKMPLISLIVFRILLFLFVKIFKRAPMNTFWEFDRKPFQDVLFNILFWLLGVGLPVFISII